MSAETRIARPTASWRNSPKLLLRIGSETLVIYEVHFVLLYSTWFGIGLSSFWYRSLTPAQAVFGAILFLLFFVLLIAHIDRIRQYRWPWWREKIAIATRIGWKWIKEAAVIFREKAILAWRVARVRVVRWYLRRTYSAYQASGEE